MDLALVVCAKTSHPAASWYPAATAPTSTGQTWKKKNTIALSKEEELKKQLHSKKR